MRTLLIAILHIGFWLCYFSLIICLIALVMRNEEDIARISYFLKLFFGFTIVPAAISFYGFYFYLFQKYRQSKKILLVFLQGVSLSFGASCVGFLTLRFILGVDCTEGTNENFISIFLIMTVFMSVIAFIIGVIALVIKGFITWIAELKLQEALKQKNYDMEMALIKAQLDPHFLFNTINNIDVLILKNAEEASVYLNKLSDIMRFMLYETKSDKILLNKELEYIEKYVELQKIRTANANYATLNIVGSSANKTIAPMMFIPFIENAFKHATNKKIEGAIIITILIEALSIKFTCENKFNPLTKNETNGLGNELIQKRLQLLYPDKHDLNVSHTTDQYSVYLKLNYG